jgi:ribonuclease BN (tRNA processing enzyme)
LALADGVDVLIHDAQHSAEELPGFAHHGHSAAEYAVRLAESAGARRLVLFHHGPTRPDDDEDALVASLVSSVPVTAAREGSIVTVGDEAL